MSVFTIIIGTVLNMTGLVHEYLLRAERIQNPAKDLR